MVFALTETLLNMLVMWLLSHWLMIVNEQTWALSLTHKLYHLHPIAFSPVSCWRSAWWERWTETGLPRICRRRTHLSSDSPGHVASLSFPSKVQPLPTSSLLAPAKTFEVFEQQGNTFAFHLTCLWRPLKYIMAEQQRFLPPLIIYLVEARSLQLTHQA